MESDPNDPNALFGPVRRSDVLTVGCLAIAVYLICAQQWPGIAGLALVGAIFCGLSPRFKGHFGFKWGSAQIGGTFVSPRGPRLQASTKRLPPAQAPRSPPAVPDED